MEIKSEAFASDVDAIVTESEAETVRHYDQQRRQRLLILLGTTFGGAIGLLLLVILFLILSTNTFGAPQITELIGIVLNVLVFVAVVLLARGGHVEWAAAFFTIGAGVLPNLNIFAISASGGASPFSVVFLMGAIVLVSLAGRPWMVFGTALLSSLTTVYMLLYAPLPTATPAERALQVYLASQGSVDLPILFVAYWGMAILLLAQWRSYQRLLIELTDVRRQVERARQLDELKDQFIRTVNHELRTPIMAVVGYIDLLMNPENRRSAERVDRYVERAHRAGDALRRLLSSILDTRRLNFVSEALVPERLDVLTMVEEVIPLIPSDAQDGVPVERALRVRLPPKASVWAEPIRFQQVLLNLLSNAVKYSEPGTPVDIDARIADEGGNASQSRWFGRQVATPAMLEISIRDHGLGIPPEQQPLLFQRFTRLPRELESNVMGTGLGLYLCKSMVEAMGGTIRVQSSGVRGEGTAMIVRLPLAPADAESLPVESTPIYVEHYTNPRLAVPSMPSVRNEEAHLG